MAKRRGKDGEFSYVDNDVNVLFEFIGIMELIDLNSVEKDEVWWRLTEKLNPMENKSRFIPDESELDALRTQAPPRKRGRLSVPSKRAR